MPAPFRLVLLLLGLSLVLPLWAMAQGNSDSDASYDQWHQDLQSVEGDLASGRLSHREQNNRRSLLLSIAQSAQKESERYARQEEGAQRLLDTLGPAPEEGAPPEAPEAQAERGKLESQLATILARKRRADLIVARANILLRQLDQARLAIFAEQLFQRSPSLLSSRTWAALPSDLQGLRASVGARLTQRHQDSHDSLLNLLMFSGAALVVLAVGVPASRALRRRLEKHRAPITTQASYRHRVAVAWVEIGLRFFVPFMVMLFLLFIALAVASESRYQTVMEPLAIAVALGSSLAIFLAAAGWAVIAPGLPNWRLLDLGERSSVALNRRWLLASAFLGLVLALRYLFGDLQPGPALLSVVHSGEALIGGFLLLSLLPSRLWQSEEQAQALDLEAAEAEGEEDQAASGRALSAFLGQARLLRFLSLLVALVVLVAAVLGYLNLSDYVALVFMSAVGLGFHLFLIRGALRDWLHATLFEGHRKVAEWRRMIFRTERGANFFEMVGFVLVDVLLVLLGLFILLPIAGIAEEEFQVWLYDVLRGFTIGGVTVEPANIIFAVLVVAIILAATRLVQRRVRGRFLEAMNVESSVQQSISTGIGYVGVISAILVGITVVGVDLTNLALIAGALSVGIGFGLQNIVSNFVAGLILLVERPIKVGDWVVVGANEGVVKRISVRATEVETWQRSSVLIPNSDLVSTAVVNWTHKDKIGRVDIPVRVPFGTDPKAVHDLLLAASEDAEDVLRFPAAYVYFKSFSPDGMDFDIRVYVPDIYNMFISVANDVRFAIVKRFNEAGVEMALPRRVLHLADLDTLEIGRRGSSESDQPKDDP